MFTLFASGQQASTWNTRMAASPSTFLWAWENPEDLRFVGTRAGVAFLSRTVILSGDNVAIKPRMQRLLVGPKTRLMAVVRIETDRPKLSPTQRVKVVEAILSAAKAKNLEGIQIDFDAKRSEREFYRALLEDVRKKLPESMGLSITALASWCMGDNWVEGLPVDEVVPMLFRMGAERDIIRRDWSGGQCGGALGLSTDEPAVGRPTAKVYWFHPGPWDKQAAEKAINRKWSP